MDKPSLCSPGFKVTDEVKLGHEKTEAQIIQHYEAIIDELHNKIDRSGITSECKYRIKSKCSLDFYSSGAG